MISRFFIDRPILASVPSIIITLAGLAAVFTLPIAQYPEIAPPTVQIAATYPGANANVVAETVATPIEQQVNGVEDMLYMSSNSGNDGSYNLTVTFKVGTDLDVAQVLVQNRVALAEPQLPDVVKQIGVTTKKRSPNILLVVNLYSPNGQFDQLFLSNYATIQIRDELARLPGVGDVFLFGQQDYSMRVWLDPDRMSAFDLTAGDVVAAVREQNVQVAAGQIGEPPVPPGQNFQYTMSTLGRLTTAEQFGAIVVKTGPDRSVVRLRDVARVELGARSQNEASTLDGRPTVSVAVFQLPGANALATADGVRAKVKELSQRFPPGLDYAIVYDTTPFVRESVLEVFRTLRDAVILVAIVVLAFLQNWRAAVIPLIAVPVAIIGTFAAMALLGFSLNNISLFGLVLAIGIVVDDAIVVVEAVEQHLAQGCTPREAAHQAMDEVSGPIVAISLVLIAVFGPAALLTGITGQFFRQFALTIAVSTLISALNSLTLSPALAALLLRGHEQRRDPLTRVLNVLLGWFFGLFNRAFAASSRAYLGGVARLLRVSALVLVLYVGLLYLTYWSFQKVPAGFIPSQDKGYALVNVQLPDAASLERTKEVLAHMDAIAQKTPGVAHTIGVAGQAVLMGVSGSNLATMFVVFKPFQEREDPALHGDVIIAHLQGAFYAEVPEAQIAVFGPPAVSGLGSAGGFKIMIEERGDIDLAKLQGQVENLTETGSQTPGIAGMFSTFRANTPQLYFDLDRTKCKMLGVGLSDVFATLQVYLGGLYVNDFNRFGRTWQVNVQADSPFRVDPRAVSELYVRNAQGQMVPLGSLATIRPIGGPIAVSRYNLYTAAAINGTAQPGVSTGTMIRTVEDLANQALPSDMAYEWTELTLLQIRAGNVALLAFIGAVVLVFLILAGLYESWGLPLSVILVVPMCILFSLAGVVIARMDMNIFTQIGFIVLVGLACKNAILIVEFAKLKHDEGSKREDAVLAAARLRLRPILMTSFAFTFGVLPLVIATGAGAELRRTLGVAVFAGMIGVTFFGIFLTPVFFHVIQGFRDRAHIGEHRAP